MSEIKDLDFDTIEKILESMDEEERAKIETLAKNLNVVMREKLSAGKVDGKAMFGRKSSLELLAKLGIFMVKNNWNGNGRAS